MVDTKRNRQQHQEFNNDHTIKMQSSFHHYDEASTLATLSNLSMSSSSDDYSTILEDYHLDSPSRSFHETKSHRSNYSNIHSSPSRESTTSTQHSSNGNANSRRRGRGKKNKSKGPQKARPSKATSTKTHDAPMRRRDMYFGLDCEMVGVGPDGLESALARVSIINWDNEIVLDTYVKVDQPVSDYRTFVSGITAEQIESDSAMPLNEVRRIVTSILQCKILIGHGLKSDLTAIGINHPWTDTRDTATFAPFMRTQECRSSDEQVTLRPRKLRELVWEKLGKQIQVMGKSHSPVEDAIAAMELYKEVRPAFESEMMKQVNAANQINDERCRRLPRMQPYHQRHHHERSMETGNMSLFPSPNHQYDRPNPNPNPMYRAPMQFINAPRQTRNMNGQIPLHC